MVTIVICVIAPKRVVVTVAISDNKTGEVFTSEYG